MVDWCVDSMTVVGEVNETKDVEELADGVRR